MKEYSWPLTDQLTRPIWTGHGFQIGEIKASILSYEIGTSGWTDELTSFHEDEAGSNHFIDLASRQYAMEQIEIHVKSFDAAFLEIGCSSGFMINLLKKKLPDALVIGSDYVREPLEHLATQLPEVPLLHFNLLKCPLPDNSLDCVVLLNVLEHIEDDLEALRQIYRILKPGGIAVVEVPAGPGLYDTYDKLLMHFRRYSMKTITRLIEQTGFKVLKKSHLGFFIYPGFWFVKQRNKRFLKQQQATQKQMVAKNISSTKNNFLLKTIMWLELKLGHVVTYPFGIRCVITLQKSL